MAHNERVATQPNKLRKLVKAGLAAVAMSTAITSPAAAKTASIERVQGANYTETTQKKDLPGLYGSAAIAKRLGTYEGLDATTDVDCETPQGGFAKIKPAKNPSTIRFEVGYPAVYELCDQVTIRSLTAVVYEHKRGDLYKEVTHVTVSGNGNNEDVARRARVTVPGRDFCADPTKEFALALRNDALPVTELVGPIYGTEVEAEGSSLFVRDRAVHLPEGTETFTPHC